jgi:hypothetical protein
VSDDVGDGAVAVVSTVPLVRCAWVDAIEGCVVIDRDDAPSALPRFRVAVLDVPTVPVLRAVLQGAAPVGAVRLWIHPDVEPKHIRAARLLGVTGTVHRARGIDGVQAALRDDGRRPTVSMIGRIADRTVVAGLTDDELLVLRRLGSGLTATQVREATGWSRHELERLRVAARTKLGVHTTGEALAIVTLTSSSPTGDAG